MTSRPVHTSSMASRTFLQRAGRALIGLSLIVLLAGCQTFSFDPDSVQASTPTAHGNALIPFHLMGDDEPDWLIPPDNAAPLVTITRQNKLAEYDFNGLSFLFYLVTLTLVPAYEEHTYIDSYELNWKGMSLVKSDIEYTIDGYFSVYFPTPLFLGSLSSGPEYQKQIAQDYLYDFHKSHLLTAIDQQREEFERIDPQTREELADYLFGPGQSSVYRPSALTRLAQLAPKDEGLAYHTEQASIPGYIEVLPESEQAWLIGPEGLKGFELKAKLNQGAGADELLVQVLNAYPEDEYAIPVVVNGQITDIREFPSGYYNGLTDNHREILKAGGLPAGLVDRMTNEAPDPQLLAAARSGKLRDANGNIRIPTEDELLEQLVRHDNQGQYMSPYTSDDVLAEWVNSAINANIGATAGTGVGAVAGAYLGEKALEQIPFVGGFLGGAVGAEIGKNVGRQTAISASGGWEAIRASSDRSFDDIASMARYLKAKYGTTENFADAMNATRQIYPELAEVLAQVR
ncbi:carboxyl-terminal protease-like protein [Marinobacter sp.]|uniref:carboxyl-terminal protease-like protein n=1 Tax=Marinobacter sp. TaxID=50741 RepID=UPI002B26990E|nr:carboxyl-terminal protease-like protein [Marinobacter sp.]